MTKAITVSRMFAGFDGYDDTKDNTLNVTATDDTTLQFVLSAPCAYIEDLMAFPAFYPVKQSEVEKYDDWQTAPGHWCQDAGFVSNGPYTCTAWEHNTSMWVNTYNSIPEGAPFGGYKNSGIGRETHKVILEHYTQMKNIMQLLSATTSLLEIWRSRR